MDSTANLKGRAGFHRVAGNPPGRVKALIPFSGIDKEGVPKRKGPDSIFRKNNQYKGMFDERRTYGRLS